jgi:hypothetical protein
MSDDPTERAYRKALELLTGCLHPSSDVSGAPRAHFEHDFDEELGMYWYGDSAPTTEPTPKAASIVRMPTFELWREAHRARRDKDEWFIVPLD